MARWQYLVKTLLAPSIGANRNCPYCSSSNTHSLGSKWVLLHLFICEKCKLMFRYPKDSFESNYSFCQHTYTESGLTAELPNETEFAELLKTAFVGSDRDFSEKIRLIKSIKQSGTVLDFGCSWGYAVWQFCHTGYNAMGFEISNPRAQFDRVAGFDVRCLSVPPYPDCINLAEDLDDFNVDADELLVIVRKMPNEEVEVSL